MLELPIELPAEADLEIRIGWAPSAMRVVVDLPRIGGGLPENDEAETYNEIGFGLYGEPLNSSGIWWRVFHFLGFEFEYAEERRFMNDAGLPTEAGRLYHLDDLVESWNELNPEFPVWIDGEGRKGIFGRTE